MKIFLDINLIKNEIVPLFKALANDDQDSVRLLTVGACVEIAKILSNEDIQEHVRFQPNFSRLQVNFFPLHCFSARTSPKDPHRG